MANTKSNKEQIRELLHTKSCMKQDVSKLTKQAFSDFKSNLKQQERDLEASLDNDCLKNIDIEYKERGDYLVEFKFASDTLVFSMHTNVFDFDESHYIHQNSYVRNQKDNAYCGIISIYNFISDSFKYKRYDDLGYLIARIFINKDGHFFVEGEQELGIKYNNFAEDKIDNDSINDIIETSILNAINFDLRTPAYKHVAQVTVHQMVEAQNNLNIATAKRLGFKFQAEQNNIVK